MADNDMGADGEGDEEGHGDIVQDESVEQQRSEVDWQAGEQAWALGQIMAADGEGAEECHEDDEQQQVYWQAEEQAWALGQMAADGEGAEECQDDSLEQQSSERVGTVGHDGLMEMTSAVHASSYHVHTDSAGYVLECVVEIYSRW